MRIVPDSAGGHRHLGRFFAIRAMKPNRRAVFAVGGSATLLCDGSPALTLADLDRPDALRRLGGNGIRHGHAPRLDRRAIAATGTSLSCAGPRDISGHDPDVTRGLCVVNAPHISEPCGADRPRGVASIEPGAAAAASHHTCPVGRHPARDTGSGPDSAGPDWDGADWDDPGRLNGVIR